MAFSRRRGRPKKTKEKIDNGTRELREKRAHGITSEPLDLCLRRGLITEAQHIAGIRLRWLYTLRFGAPSVSAYSPDRLGGVLSLYEDNSVWMARRQREYLQMLLRLDKTGSRKIVMDVCVFGRIPAFMHYRPSSVRANEAVCKEFELFVRGMEGIE